jgi:hypothetical protein
LHLTIDGGVVDGFTTIYVVVAQLAADHHILDIDVVAIATGTAAADDAVGVELINHSLGTKGGIDFADATLLYQHVTVVEQLLQLVQLLVHGYNNTYFHMFYTFCAQSYEKKL